jgi:hypothetical protein
MAQGLQHAPGAPPDPAPQRLTLSKWCHNGAMNITLKNVPDKIHAEMKKLAAKEGRSMNAQILMLMEHEAGVQARRRKLRKLLPRLDQFVASMDPMEDSTAMIRAHRDA